MVPFSNRHFKMSGFQMSGFRIPTVLPIYASINPTCKNLSLYLIYKTQTKKLYPEESE